VWPTFGFVLFEIGRLPLHEFVEQGYGEGSFTVALTPNHAFVDQLLAHSRDRSGHDAEHGRNVAGLVRTWPEFQT
jgi:hypothetical protein